MNFNIIVIIIWCFSPKHVDAEQSVRQAKESRAPFADRSYIRGCPQASEWHYRRGNTDFEHFTGNALITASVSVRKWSPANSLPVSKHKKVRGWPLVLKVGGWEVTAPQWNPTQGGLSGPRPFPGWWHLVLAQTFVPLLSVLQAGPCELQGRSKP